MVYIHIRGDCLLNVSLQKVEVYSVNCLCHIRISFSTIVWLPFQIYVELFHIFLHTPETKKEYLELGVLFTPCFPVLSFQFHSQF